jgi:hypothetical protein
MLASALVLSISLPINRVLTRGIENSSSPNGERDKQEKVNIKRTPPSPITKDVGILLRAAI